MTDGTRAGAPPRVEEAVRFGCELVDAWGSWSPTMTPDARRVAFVSDRSGSPEAWVQDVLEEGEPAPAEAAR